MGVLVASICCKSCRIVRRLVIGSNAWPVVPYHIVPSSTGYNVCPLEPVDGGRFIRVAHVGEPVWMAVAFVEMDVAAERGQLIDQRLFALSRGCSAAWPCPPGLKRS